MTQDSINQYIYAKQKLVVTIESLATDPDDVRKRLSKSYILFHMLTEDDFPTELQKDWKWIIKELTRFGPYYVSGVMLRCSVENTMKKVKNSTGVKIGERLYKLHNKINKDY